MSKVYEKDQPRRHKSGHFTRRVAIDLSRLSVASNDASRRIQYESFVDIQKRIQYVHQQGFSYLDFAGPYAWCHPDVLDLMREAEEHQMPVRLVLDAGDLEGTCPDSVEQDLQRFIDAGLVDLDVHVSEWTPNTSQVLRLGD